MPGIQWVKVALDTLVSRDPGYFHGCVLTPSSVNSRVRFYNGTDATTGEQVIRLHSHNHASTVMLFPAPLYCSRGLFVADLSKIDDLLVLWEPVEDEPAGF